MNIWKTFMKARTLMLRRARKPVVMQAPGSGPAAPIQHLTATKREADLRYLIDCKAVRMEDL